jgi:hypothetical protein
MIPPIDREVKPQDNGAPVTKARYGARHALRPGFLGSKFRRSTSMPRCCVTPSITPPNLRWLYATKSRDAANSWRLAGQPAAFLLLRRMEQKPQLAVVLESLRSTAHA